MDGVKIPVIEIFGPTIQGEGAVIGKKTVFIRTAGCDYQCSWCDSAFTWDGSGKDEITFMTSEEVMSELERIGFDQFEHVTISGGNPALLKGLKELIFLIKQKQLKIGLETQGSVWQDWFLSIDDLTISPKPPSSGMEVDFETLASIVKRLEERITQGAVTIKVVIFNDIDLQFAKKVHQLFYDVPFYLQVGNDAIFETDELQLKLNLLKKLEWLVDKVVSDPDFNRAVVLPQLHTLIWGNKKGV